MKIDHFFQVISSVAAEIQGLHAEEKSHTLVSMLQNRCSHLQAPFVAKIEQLGLQYQTFWASNIILVKALNLETLNELLLIQSKQYTYVFLFSFKGSKNQIARVF